MLRCLEYNTDQQQKEGLYDDLQGTADFLVVLPLFYGFIAALDI